ncbi:unnamed protein product [Prorocentrum cordatum]|uniref:AAA+ ATPase domain-containing protein n=1 Tax=Prorocentrum cordatum TaxID=2364126 RepID=A0ABN9WW40_9DINO|nr:unnamed protein product [Polarella glacialis]
MAAHASAQPPRRTSGAPRRRPSRRAPWRPSAVRARRGRCAARGRRAAAGRPAAAGGAPALEAFSGPAVQSVAAAFACARRLGHASAGGGVGTDHLLVGMAATAGSCAARALRSVGLTAEVLEAALAQSRGRGAPEPAPGWTEQLAPPLGAEARFYLSRAARMLRWQRAPGAGARVLGTEHVLLGLLSNGSHAAQRLLLAVDEEGFGRTVTQFDSGTGGAASNPRRAALRDATMRLVNDKEGDALPVAALAERPGGVQASGAPVGTAVLDKFSTDLTALAGEGLLDPFAGHGGTVARVERALGRRRKRSVLLVGDPGVGKTALVEAVAQRISKNGAPPWLLQRRICSLDVAALTAGTRLRGDFEERLGAVLAEAEAAGVVLFVDEGHVLIGAGATASSSVDAANMLKPALARGALQCIVATTVQEYQKHFARDAALERRFEVVEVEEPSPSETAAILETLRPRYEGHHDVLFAPGAIAAAAEWSARHLPERRLPDKAIDVVDRAAVRASLRDGAAAKVTLDDIAAAVEEAVGLRPGAVTAAEALQSFGLESALGARVAGQPEAVGAVAAMVARAKAGLQDEGKPLGSLLLYGPPGVGKTSLACALAEVWLGSPRALVRVDCASAAVAPGGAQAAAARLAAAARRRPHCVVLVDEADKADAALQGTLLQVLEEGCLCANGPGDAGRADFRHAAVLLTSNDPRGAEALPRALGDRLDEAVAFRPLGEAQLAQALDRLLEGVGERLRRVLPGATLRVTEAWRAAALRAALDPDAGQGGDRGISFSADYVGCKKCGYRWTYKTKQSCYSCGQALRPSYSPAPKPRGVWASGSRGWWQDNHKGQTDWYHEAEETTQRTEPLAIGEVVQTLGGQALSEAQRQALQQLESAFAPPAPAERPALLEEGIQRAAAAERAARRELEKRAKQLADAKLWLDECQARSDAAADALVGAEVKLAQEKKALAAPGKDSQPEGTNKGGGVINLSALLGEGEASFVIEDGPLFDLEGLDITAEQREQFNKLKQTFEASVQQAVRTHFGPGADVLKSQREQFEEIRVLRETFKKRRRRVPRALRQVLPARMLALTLVVKPLARYQYPMLYMVGLMAGNGGARNVGLEFIGFNCSSWAQAIDVLDEVATSKIVGPMHITFFQVHKLIAPIAKDIEAASFNRALVPHPLGDPFLDVAPSMETLDPEYGGLELSKYLGNQSADLQAKDGAKLDAIPPHIRDTWVARFKEVCAVFGLVGDMTCKIGPDGLWVMTDGMHTVVGVLAWPERFCHMRHLVMLNLPCHQTSHQLGGGAAASSSADKASSTREPTLARSAWWPRRCAGRRLPCWAALLGPRRGDGVRGVFKGRARNVDIFEVAE